MWSTTRGTVQCRMSGALCGTVNPPSHLQASALIFFLLAYVRITHCFHCRKMALPDSNDPTRPLPFYDDIAAAERRLKWLFRI